MLNPEQQALLEQLLRTLSRDQRLWLSGYLQGAGENGGETPASANAPVIQVYFATETGNSKRIAQDFAKAAKNKGFRAQIQPIGKLDLKTLAGSAAHAVFIASTHGEGDPPDAAKRFYETLPAAGALSLAPLTYTVLGLGDRAYAKFCQAAVDLDDRLSALGASAFRPIETLDVDFDDHVPAWLESVFASLPVTGGATSATAAPVSRTASGPGYTRLSPITGTIKEIVNLNDIGSAKETYHIEIVFTAPVQYLPGDAIGIILPEGHPGAAEPPRLYSIASSQSAYPNEVHLTVSHAWHELPGGGRGFGLCSHYLAGLSVGEAVRFYIHRNHQFRLPEDDKPIIMVGPGTGIAPFRAFVQERDARGASGGNWLFFGEQHAHCDFLYQAEWQDYLASGALHRIGLAFSRDGRQKRYVQHLMAEHGEELLQWLDDGAHLYVCGSKSPMSEDVEQTLLELIATHKGLSPEAARDALDALAEENRYVKDVY